MSPERGDDVPEGFGPLAHASPFLHQFGPLHARRVEGRLVIALRVAEKHLNVRGIAHGGMLVTLADSALGIVVSTSQPAPRALVTVSLTTDFVDAAHRGDWVEAHVDVQKVGQRLAFASCYLVVGERRILRASGVFAFVPARHPRESSDG